VRKFRIQELALLAVIAVALLALALPPLAFSQGCSLCYTQAANSGARLIRALRSGIVILIIPPLSICLGAIFLTCNKRNQFHRADRSPEAGSDW